MQCLLKIDAYLPTFKYCHPVDFYPALGTPPTCPDTPPKLHERPLSQFPEELASMCLYIEGWEVLYCNHHHFIVHVGIRSSTHNIVMVSNVSVNNVGCL